MLSSGSAPLTVKRGSMWTFLMFAGAAWLVIGWAVLRLEAADIAAVAGPVVLFGAVCEMLRALAGTRTWWLNAGMAVLFTATGLILMLGIDSSLTAPASLIGWYLMVRGAIDVAVGIMTRGSDRVWSLLVTVGVLETGLGFFSASPFARSAELVTVVLGGLGILRAVAELVTALRLREVAGPRRDVLELPPERAAGLAGYAAGMADTENAPRERVARHRARPDDEAETFHDRVVRTTADLDSMLAQAGVTNPRAGAAHRETTAGPASPGPHPPTATHAAGPHASGPNATPATHDPGTRVNPAAGTHTAPLSAGAHAAPLPAETHAAPLPAGAHAAPMPVGAHAAAPAPAGLHMASLPNGMHNAPATAGMHMAPMTTGTHAAPELPEDATGDMKKR
ncbi:hypothetical protein [Actinoplanes sp. G11-F43]|uniref:HdeD family acid-resistance protein n=1 Tax=Actinoplanes sp. G11-F43 TaxID=3424130 RepID=UPI003D339A10